MNAPGASVFRLPLEVGLEPALLLSIASLLNVINIELFFNNVSWLRTTKPICNMQKRITTVYLV